MTTKPTPALFPQRRRLPARAWPVWLAPLLLGACGTYEPPKPGVYAGLNGAKGDVSCEYEIPTATRFMSMKCRSAEDRQGTRDSAQRAADGLRTPVPRID